MLAVNLKTETLTYPLGYNYIFLKTCLWEEMDRKIWTFGIVYTEEIYQGFFFSVGGLLMKLMIPFFSWT